MVAAPDEYSCMSDISAWIIALGFYAPIHYLGPGLVVLLSGNETTARRTALLRSVAIHCTLSMLLAFAVALLVFPDAPRLAAALLLAAALTPYLHLWLKRRVAR